MAESYEQYRRRMINTDQNVLDRASWERRGGSPSAADEDSEPTPGERYISLLEELMSRKPPKWDVPAQKIPGMTDIETMGQSLLRDLILRQEDYDPSTSPYYESVREEAAHLKREGTEKIRRRSQLGGMLYSTPSARTESEFTSAIDRGLMSELGRLSETERARKLQEPYSKLGAIASYGALPRQIESAQKASVHQNLLQRYQSKLQGYILPMQYQAPIAQNLLSFMYPQQQPQQQSSGGGFLSALGPFMSILGMATGNPLLAAGGMGGSMLGSRGGGDAYLPYPGYYTGGGGNSYGAYRY